ncbi:MAG: energy transducer TonB [Bacteroidota bacterium]|nr:energy transducer TonB [Candidatus Kapabacteria bacterium]MDW8220691.1 energy transducer TonB [Bacteroidota bacterium]
MALNLSAQSLSTTGSAGEQQQPSRNLQHVSTPHRAVHVQERTDYPSQSPELQYIRLSDLASEGNTQHSFIPAQYDPQELQRHLRQAFRNQEQSGKVDIIVYLDHEGTIKHINYVSEQSNIHSSFAHHACEAVRKCTFRPAYRDNKPVHSVIVIPIRLVL